SDAAGAEFFGHEVRCEGFADRTEDSLIHAVEDEEGCDQRHVAREREAEIRDEEDKERRQEDVFSSPPVREKPCGVGDERRDKIEDGIDEDGFCQGDAKRFRLQDKEGVTRIAYPEESGYE